MKRRSSASGIIAQEEINTSLVSMRTLRTARQASMLARSPTGMKLSNSERRRAPERARAGSIGFSRRTTLIVQELCGHERA